MRCWLARRRWSCSSEILPTKPRGSEVDRVKGKWSQKLPARDPFGIRMINQERSSPGARERAGARNLGSSSLGFHPAHQGTDLPRDHTEILEAGLMLAK